LEQARVGQFERTFSVATQTDSTSSPARQRGTIEWRRLSTATANTSSEINQDIFESLNRTTTPSENVTKRPETSEKEAFAVGSASADIQSAVDIHVDNARAAPRLDATGSNFPCAKGSL
jgi:hypothetical protein